MRSASQSGLRTDSSGSRAPKARIAATAIDVREGWPGPKGRESALVGIFVDTFSDFFPKSSCFYVFHQERARTILFAERLMEKIEDAQPGIQTDQVDHLKRPHRMIQTEFDGFIDITRAGDTFLQQI